MIEINSVDMEGEECWVHRIEVQNSGSDNLAGIRQQCL